MSLREDFNRFTQDYNKFIQDSREFQGKAMASLDNLEKYVGAVSEKANVIREVIDSHKDDPKAHGAEIGRATIRDIFMIIGSIMGAAALVLAIWRAAHGG